MNERPQIKIEPKTYKGWNLKHETGWSEKPRFIADCERSSLWADTLQELINKIDEAEKRVVRLKRPIKILNLRDYGSKEYTPAVVTFIDDGKIYMEHPNGEVTYTDAEKVSEQCNDGTRSRLKHALDTKENRQKIEKYKRMCTKGYEILEQADFVLKSLEPLTNVDIKEAL